MAAMVVVVVVEGRRVFTSVAGGHLCGNICGTDPVCCGRAGALHYAVTRQLRGTANRTAHYPTVAICDHELALNIIAGANPYPPPCDEVPDE